MFKIFVITVIALSVAFTAPVFADSPTTAMGSEVVASPPAFMEAAAPVEVEKSTDIDESIAKQEINAKKTMGVNEPVAQPIEKEKCIEEADDLEISDPFEKINRVAFTFNDRLYFWVAKPVAQGYRAVVPECGRVGVRNVFQNAAMPVRFVNCLFQVKIKEAGTELYCFTVNTIAGVGGLFNITGDAGLKSSNRDLGQTLGVYGLGSGPYIVLPIFGPSSLRDTVGTVGDMFLNPVSYITPAGALLGVRTFDYTNETSLRIGDYESIKDAAIDDPYTSIRDIYFQYKQGRIERIKD